MRKLTKKALSLVLCVMLVVSAISCAFSVIAEGANEEASIIVGTGKDGQTGTVKGFTASDVNEGLANADFSEGFKDWAIFRRWDTIADTAEGLTGIATVENGVVTIKGRSYMDDGTTTFTSEGLGLVSQAFTIPGLQAGDKLIMTLDATTNSKIRGALGEYNTTANDGVYSLKNEAFSNPSSANINIPYELWVTPELTVTDPNAYFVVTIRNKDVTKDVSFKNVRIYKVTAENNLIDVTAGCTPDSQPMNANGGTVEDGMIVARNSSNTYYSTDVVTTGLMNGDFSNGLKYWRLGKARRGYASYVASVVDGALNLVAYNSGNNENTTLRTSKMNLDAYAGKTISFSAETSKAGLGFYALVYEDGTQIAKKSIWAAGTIVVPDITIKEGSLYELEFRIEAQVNGSQNGKVSVIDNVTLIAPEEPEEPEEPTAPADSEAPYYDVDGKGIKSTNVEYPFQLKPVEQVSNLDFEDGFRFWAGGKGKGTYGDTAFDIETDGDNSYARIPATGYVSNFQTALLKIEGVTAGDQIVIIYDVKGTDGNKIRIKAEQEFVKSIAVYDVTTGLNTTKKADGVTLINVTPGVPNVVVGTGTESSNFAVNLTDGWTTLIASTGQPLAAPSSRATYTSDPIADAYYIKLLVTCGDAGVVAGDVIDAAIDNIRIAKFANGVYTDVVTGEEIYTDPAYGKVAKVGDGYFATLEEAIAAANGGTVVLLKDIALADSVVIEAGTNIVLDLNGKTISRDTDAATSTAAIVNNGTLTIEDSVGGGKITAYAANPDTAEIPYYASNTITNCGVLTIKGGTIENSTGDDARAAFPIDNNSTVRDAILNIEGGTISGRGAIRQFANSTTNKNEVNITGGTVSGSSYGIWMQNPGSSDPLAALNVSGGTVAKILLSPSANFEPAITGGTISEIAIWDASGDANRDPSGFITGGTFNTAVAEDFCAEGFAPVDNGDGTFGIEEKEVIATVGGVNYYDFYEALEAAKNTEEKEMTVLKSIVITEDGTLDLGGVTVYAANSVQNAPVFRILANVTVTNGSVDGTTGINSYAFIVGNGETAGTLTIADGNYRGVTTAVQVSNGTANISGGTFQTGHDNEGTDWGTTYLLNCMDAAYNNGTANFNITGGTFVGFNPENNAAEGADTNFLVIAYMAQDNGDGSYSVVERPVIATVGGVNYYDLQEAINAANGGTVVLSTNITLDAPVVIAKDTVVTIDLNGKKITYTSTVQGEAMISNKGTLTINDTVGGGEIYYDYVGAADPSYSKGNYTIDNAGTLTLNEGKINIATLRQHAKYPINNNSTTGDAIFVMNGGKLYNYNTSAIRQFCNSTVYQNSVTINGGLVEGYSAIWVQNPGKNTVNGTLTITGGEIRTTAKAYVNGEATVGEVSSNIYFTIDGEGGAWSETSAVVITGGTFNENVYLTTKAPANLTVDETAPTYNGRVELPVVEEYDLETELYWVKGFKPAGSEDTRYGFLMTIGIDSLDYQKDGCGFYLTVGDTTKKFIIVNGTVWESLSVDLPTETKVLAPVDFGEGNQYIMHYTVYFTEPELEALGSMEVSVKGFVTTFEGEELVTKTFNCGTLA